MRQTRNYNSRRNGKSYRSPYKTYFAIAFILIVILLVGGLFVLKYPVYVAYIAGINIITFIFYAFDKFQAKRNGGRIPEMVLHGLALAGGAIGGLAGQWLLHHKTRKPIFHFILWASLIAHLVIFALFHQALL